MDWDYQVHKYFITPMGFYRDYYDIPLFHLDKTEIEVNYDNLARFQQSLFTSKLIMAECLKYSCLLL